MKIREFLDDIRKYDLVLPEFQREYVWSLEQAKQLMVSLVRGYPVGGVLLWKTDSPPPLKNVDKLPDKLGTVKVLLDGQQRLTALNMLINGDIPVYYTKEEIKSDPRDLRINLNTLDFQYYQPSRMKDDWYWHRVIDCFDFQSGINPIEIAEKKSAENSEALKDIADRLYENLKKIQGIQDIQLPVQMVPPDAKLDKAIDIFDRINSQGTKLTDAELALTHMTGKWPAARREMKEKLDECASKNFKFNLTFMTRALTVTVTNRTSFETIHDRSREELEDGWKKLTTILDYLITVLPQKAFIHSTDDLATNNALIPLVAYLCNNGGKFSNEKSINHAINWLYAALMWARYTAQTDQRLEADVLIIVKESEPWDALRANIVDQRGRIEVKASDFESRGTLHPLYKVTSIVAKAHGAVDWFNGVPLAQTHGTSYGIHSHHIFPQSLLYKNGYDPDNHVHRQSVNEIANRAFLTAITNQEISNKAPGKYLPEIEQNYPGALSSQFVPTEPELWMLDRYDEFLARRRRLIALKLNEFMDSLISEPEETHRRPISELVELGESYVLEFKSTLQWSVIDNQQNKALRGSSLKTIAAFMNSQGGTLVIGVEDDGNIFGLDTDLKLTGGSLDKFEQLLGSLIAEKLGVTTVPYCTIRFEGVDEKQVCTVDVQRSAGPVFMKTEKGPQLYIRVGNTTRALNSEETHQHIETHWE